VQQTLAKDRNDAELGGLAQWYKWKDDLKERTGFESSVEYNSLLQGYSDAGAGDRGSAGGIFRVSGRWTLLGRDT